MSDERVFLKARRVVLRDMEETDRQGVYEYATDPEVNRYLFWRPKRKAEVRERVRQIITEQSKRPRTHYRLLIEHISTRETLGSCGLIVEPGRTALLTFILKRTAWGSGFARESVSTLFDFGFGPLGLHRIHALCHTANAGSIKLMERLGMRREGHHIAHSHLNDDWCDVYSYAILKREWKERADENR